MAFEDVSTNILKIVESLNHRGVRYLLVGGTAVAFYGFVRPTTNREGQLIDKDDFDFWFQPTYLNYKKLLNAITDMGFDVEKYKEEEFPFPKSSFFKFRPKDYSLDFLPRVGGGLLFSSCYEKKTVSVITGIEVNIISLQDLMIAKKFAGRKKDLDDIAALERINNLSL